jgi:hypothetical protein
MLSPSESSPHNSPHGQDLDVLVIGYFSTLVALTYVCGINN